MINEENTYRIMYDIHCSFKNFFNKEIIIKNCCDEVHTKHKLTIYCEKKYGAEFEYISVKSIIKELPQYGGGLFDTLFGSSFDKDLYKNNPFMDLFSKRKKS